MIRSLFLAGVLMSGAVCAQEAQKIERSTAPQADRLTLRFGVYTSDIATDMLRSFKPVLDGLENKLVGLLGLPVEIRMRIFPTYADAHDGLVEHEVDFVRFGPASYVLVKERDPGITLLAMEKQDGKKRFEGMIVVRRDSPIRTLTDLRGKRFAFGDRDSTIGRYLVQDLLVRAGITQQDLDPRSDYLGRHDKVFRAVEYGDFDAGSVKSTTFEKLNKENKPLRVLQKFDNVTKPWIAASGLEPDVRLALRRALLSFRDAEALKGLSISGFALAFEEDYRLVREGMAGSRKFEGLHPDEGHADESPPASPPSSPPKAGR